MMKNKILMALAVALIVGAGSAFAANTLAVNASAALNGTNFGMEITVDPAATNPVYVQSDHPNAETHMIIKGRIRVADLVAPASGGGRTFRMMNMLDTDFAGQPHKIFFLQRQVTTGNWRFLAWGRNNAGTYGFLGAFFWTGHLSTADLQFNCEWTKAAGVGNGTLFCEKVGTAQNFTNATVDDSNYQTDGVQWGFFDFDGFGNNGGSGSIDFDEYESYR